MHVNALAYYVRVQFPHAIDDWYRGVCTVNTNISSDGFQCVTSAGLMEEIRSHMFSLMPAAARLLGLWVRIPSRVWMSLSCECCVLSGRGLCVGLITRPEESYRVWCVSECDREASKMRRSWPNRGCKAMRKQFS
jgi:hypothetical protein